MPKLPTKITREKPQYKVTIVRHLEEKEQEDWLNVMGEENWELIAVDNGVAYLQRFVEI